MKIQTMIMLESGEKHMLNRVYEALNLVGWRGADQFKSVNNRSALDMTPERQEEYKVFKSINRVRSDQFSMEDVENMDAHIRRMANELLAKAAAGGVFADKQLDAMFSDGVRTSAQLAIRNLESFRAELQEALDEHRGVTVDA